MNVKRQRAGQLGGISTFMRYGPGYMRRLGAKGGRPRNPTLEELRQPPAPDDPANIKRRERLPLALRDLKGLFKLRNMNRGRC